MNTIAQYSALSTPGLNQVSKMLPDNNGYYKCILGGFNLSNRSGLYYPLTSGIKNMFNTSVVTKSLSGNRYRSFRNSDGFITHR